MHEFLIENPIGLGLLIGCSLGMVCLVVLVASHFICNLLEHNE